jgi:hypothetical protein
MTFLCFVKNAWKLNCGSRDISVSTKTTLWPGSPRNHGSITGRDKRFFFSFLHCVQTSSGASPTIDLHTSRNKMEAYAKHNFCRFRSSLLNVSNGQSLNSYEESFVIEHSIIFKILDLHLYMHTYVFSWKYLLIITDSKRLRDGCWLMNTQVGRCWRVLLNVFAERLAYYSGIYQMAIVGWQPQRAITHYRSELSLLYIYIYNTTTVRRSSDQPSLYKHPDKSVWLYDK